MMRSASLYILKNNIVLYSESVGDSAWKAAAPFYKLPVNYDLVLVKAMKDALAHSKENVVFEPNYSPGKELKEATGLTFSKLQGVDVKLVSLSQQGNTITLSPNKVIGPNKGFIPLNESRIDISADTSDEEILVAIKKAISLCESPD